jgi:signal transduction histidine kinase
VTPSFEVEADRNQFYRVLSNLARNALEAGAHRLRVSTTYKGRSIVIDIADDGPGLPPKARENLFRPFFGSARPGGTGLGLAIARELVRAHGGDLMLVASTGRGTEFRIELPAPNARPAAAALSRKHSISRERVSSS